MHIVLPGWQILSQYSQQFPAINGFGQVTITTGVNTLLAIAFHGIGSQGHDGGFIALLPKGTGGLVSIHMRHLYVHQYQVKDLGLSLLNSLFAVVGNDNLKPDSG